MRTGAGSALTAFLASTLIGVQVAAAADAADSPPAEPWLAPSVTYDGSVLGNLDGGAQRRGAYVGNLHLKALANGDAIDFEGTSAFVDVINIHGGHPTRLVGDAQGTTNIEGPAGTQVEEL